MRYRNNSNYKQDTEIRKKAYVSQAVLDELKRIIADAEVSPGGQQTNRQRCRRYQPAASTTHAAVQPHQPLVVWTNVSAALHGSKLWGCLPVPCSAFILSHSKQIMKEDDNNWPMPDRVGKQELEIKMNGEHICFNTTKLGSVLQVQQSKDPDGLRIFYYLVQVRTQRTEGLGSGASVGGQEAGRGP